MGILPLSHPTDLPDGPDPGAAQLLHNWNLNNLKMIESIQTMLRRRGRQYGCRPDTWNRHSTQAVYANNKLMTNVQLYISQLKVFL